MKNDHSLEDGLSKYRDRPDSEMITGPTAELCELRSPVVPKTVGRLGLLGSFSIDARDRLGIHDSTYAMEPSHDLEYEAFHSTAELFLFFLRSQV